jgi:predicted house-cleaning NTP pyrophosphatase (Maf/HAM1 superfamily)
VSPGPWRLAVVTWQRHLSCRFDHPHQLQIVLGSQSSFRRRILERLGVRFMQMPADLDEKALPARAKHGSDLYAIPMLVAGAKCDKLVEEIKVPAIVITADQVVLTPRDPLSRHPTAEVLSPVRASEDDEGGEVRHAVSGSRPGDLAALARVWPSCPCPDDLAPALGVEAGQHLFGYAPMASKEASPRAVGPVELREKPSSIEEMVSFIRSYSGSWVQCVSGVVVHNTATNQRVVGLDIATVLFDDIDEATISEVAKQAASGEESPMHCCGAVMVEHPLLADHVISMDRPKDAVQGLPSDLLTHLLEQVGFHF